MKSNNFVEASVLNGAIIITEKKTDSRTADIWGGGGGGAPSYQPNFFFAI
jgi:hypothetical protein